MGRYFGIRKGPVRLPEQLLGFRKLPELVVDPDPCCRGLLVPGDNTSARSMRSAASWIALCVIGQGIAQGI